MDDLLDAVRGGANGTAANFSGWNGVKEGNFHQIKSHERVIEPEQEEQFAEEQTIEQEEENKIYSQRPAAQQEAYLNPAELKSIAIKLMPSVDNMPNYTREAIRAVSENAINIAFEFLQVWNEKVSVSLPQE